MYFQTRLPISSTQAVPAADRILLLFTIVGSPSKESLTVLDETGVWGAAMWAGAGVCGVDICAGSECGREHILGKFEH